MKTKLYTTVLLLSTLLFGKVTNAQTSYLVTSNSSWSTVLPATCANCTIVISTGATLTVDKAVTCQNCSFQGGAISMTDFTMNIQFSGSVYTTQFKNTSFTINGNSGKVIVNAPLSLHGSTLIFNNGSYFNTSYQVDLASSSVTLNDNATMYSTGGSSTPINLSSNSRIDIGNGSRTSNAGLTVSGPTLNIFDNSLVALGNNNNVYYNWSNYNAAAGKGAGTTKSYSTSTSTMNCGGAGQKACSNPSLYGPAALTTAGVVPGGTLPVILAAFSARNNGDGTVLLSWETKMEQNASRFEIERSADGTVWSKIGSVAAVGTSSNVSTYSFMDAGILPGVNYYRLKMVDLDGSTVYSEVQAVRSSTMSKISFYPNPARDFVNVTLGAGSTGLTTIRLVNQAGAVLQEKTVQAGSGMTVTLPLQQVANGMYVVYVVSADGGRVTAKLLVNKN